jgi:hypothetical protein
LPDGRTASGKTFIILNFVTLRSYTERHLTAYGEGDGGISLLKGRKRGKEDTVQTKRVIASGLLEGFFWRGGLCIAVQEYRVEQCAALGRGTQEPASICFGRGGTRQLTFALFVLCGIVVVIVRACFSFFLFARVCPAPWWEWLEWADTIPLIAGMLECAGLNSTANF